MCGEVFPLMQALMSTEETASPAFSPATPTAELTRPPALILTGEWVRDVSCFSRENSRGRGAPGAQEGPGAAGSISHLPGCTPCSCALPCTSTEPFPTTAHPSPRSLLPFLSTAPHFRFHLFPCTAHRNGTSDSCSVADQFFLCQQCAPV